MAGDSRTYNLITLNIAAGLHRQLIERDCEVYASDMRVKVSTAELFTYPDVVVVCGPADFEDDFHDTLLNPNVIFEVLSKSTEAYDRGSKFAHFRRLVRYGNLFWCIRITLMWSITPGNPELHGCSGNTAKLETGLT